MSDGICVVDLERKQHEVVIAPPSVLSSTSPLTSSNSSSQCVQPSSPKATEEDNTDEGSPPLKDEEDNCSVAMESFTTAASSLSLTEFCKICHCGAEPSMPLIAPCFCDGSLKYVHQECLQRWIKSSDIKRCELCKYLYIMQSKVKPFCQWEKLDMSSLEKRKLLCSIMFHIVAITCVIWSLYVLINRTAEEIKDGNLYWPFWTKLIVVAIGFTGGVVFMYIQCRVYVHLCRKWKAYNRIIVVQDIPEYSLKPKIKKVSLTLSGDQSGPPPALQGSNISGEPNGSQNPSATSPTRGHPSSGGNSFSQEQPPPNDECMQQKGTMGQQSHSLSSSTSEISSGKAPLKDVSPAPLSAPSAAISTAASKSNAETQTALRGVSLLRVLRDTSESDEPADLQTVSKILIDDSVHTSIFIANETRQEDMGTASSLLLPGQSSEEEETSTGQKASQVGE